MQDRFRFRYFDNSNRMQEISLTNCYYTNLDYSRLMQCTGLQDKNGKLIYEGDIVKDLIMSGIFYIVKWFNSGFYLESTISGSFLKFNDTQQEVIGNIYENPELLEKGT